MQNLANAYVQDIDICLVYIDNFVNTASTQPEAIGLGNRLCGAQPSCRNATIFAVPFSMTINRESSS